MADVKKDNGVEFEVGIEYEEGCRVSSLIFNTDANKDIVNAIVKAVLVHFEKFPWDGKIRRVAIDLKEI